MNGFFLFSFGSCVFNLELIFVFFFYDRSVIYGIKIGFVLYNSFYFFFGNIDRKNVLMCNVSKDCWFFNYFDFICSVYVILRFLDGDILVIWC